MSVIFENTGIGKFTFPFFFIENAIIYNVLTLESENLILYLCGPHKTNHTREAEEEAQPTTRFRILSPVRSKITLLCLSPSPASVRSTESASVSFGTHPFIEDEDEE